MLELLLTVGFFVWGAGEGGALLLWLPLLLFKFMFFALFFGFFAFGARPPRRRRRPRRSRRPADPEAEAERRQYQDDLRQAHEEVDSWTTFDV